MPKNHLNQAYHSCKQNAKKRKIQFLLSFDEWLSIWVQSGKLEKRGAAPNQYCMARFNDSGHYQVGNVKIITMAENNKEQVSTKHTMEWRAIVSARMSSDNPAKRPEVRAKISAEARSRPPISEELRIRRAMAIKQGWHIKRIKQQLVKAFVHLPTIGY